LTKDTLSCADFSIRYGKRPATKVHTCKILKTTNYKTPELGILYDTESLHIKYSYDVQGC